MNKKKNIKIIAEIGVNHNGNISTAKKLIVCAKDCGADFVKFQNWKADTLVTKKASMAEYQVKNVKKKISQYEMLKPLELKNNDYFTLKTFAQKKKIQFISSPFDEESFEFISSKLNCKIIKIPSGEINNFLMLSRVDLKKHNLLISTGMSTLEDIARCLNFISKTEVYKFKKNKIIILNKNKVKFLKRKICLFHCVTDYPVEENYANLNSIKTIEKNFSLPVGYSDHTIGILAPLICIPFGVKFIEKHITLNKKLAGPDHQASLSPKEFKKMVQNIRSCEKMLGNGIKKPQKCEIKNMKIARKSIVATKVIKKGEVFTIKNVTVKRPAGGKDPSLYFKILGKKSTQNYLKDQKI